MLVTTRAAGPLSRTTSVSTMTGRGAGWSRRPAGSGSPNPARWASRRRPELPRRRALGRGRRRALPGRQLLAAGAAGTGREPPGAGGRRGRRGRSLPGLGGAWPGPPLAAAVGGRVRRAGGRSRADPAGPHPGESRPGCSRRRSPTRRGRPRPCRSGSAGTARRRATRWARTPRGRGRWGESPLGRLLPACPAQLPAHLIGPSTLTVGPHHAPRQSGRADRPTSPGERRAAPPLS